MSAQQDDNAPVVEEPHHRAARQLTDEERDAVRRSTLATMRAGLPGLKAKARVISERHGGGAHDA
jgi:hypothetical protein